MSGSGVVLTYLLAFNLFMNLASYSNVPFCRTGDAILAHQVYELWFDIESEQAYINPVVYEFVSIPPKSAFHYCGCDTDSSVFAEYPVCQLPFWGITEFLTWGEIEPWEGR